MRHLFLSLFTVLLFTSCSNGPQKLLNQAQNELIKYENINYTIKGLYPNPMGKIDIREASVFLRKNEKITSIPNSCFLAKFLCIKKRICNA